MTSCSSSLEGDCTRISVPWIDAWAFLNFLSLIALTMAFAFSCAMPCVSLISRRTVSPAAGVTGPSSRFFTGTPRLTSLVCSTSSSAFILKSSSATSVSAAWAQRLGGGGGARPGRGAGAGAGVCAGRSGWGPPPPARRRGGGGRRWGRGGGGWWGGGGGGGGVFSPRGGGGGGGGGGGAG